MRLTEQEELAALRRRQAELSERLTELGGEIQSLESRRLHFLHVKLTALGDEIKALESRLSEPAPVPPVQAVPAGVPFSVTVVPSTPPPVGSPVPAREPAPVAIPPLLSAETPGQATASARNQVPPTIKTAVPPVETGPSPPAAKPLLETTTEPGEIRARRSAAELIPPAAATPGASFEMRLGTYWLVRVGVLMVLTALAFFGAFAYQNIVPRLGPAHKVGLLYFASSLLLGAGLWLQRKDEKIRNYAQVLTAGGLAAVYFTTYAAHHIPALQVIKSVLVDGALLFGWAGMIVVMANRKKSEVLALFAILLAYYSSVITHTGLFTLYSNLVLTLAACFFLVRNRWSTLSFASLIGTYAGYAFWRFYQNGEWRLALPGEGLWPGNCFLISYWVVFTAALLLSKHQQFEGGRRATFLSLNNGAFFAAFLLTMVELHTGRFWQFSLLYGSVLLGLAAAAWRLHPADRVFRNAYLTQGLALVTLGIVVHYSGLRLSAVLAAESFILVVLGRQLESRVMDVASWLAAALAILWGITRLEAFNAQNLGSAAAVGLVMVINAFCHRDEPRLEPAGVRPRSLYFTVLGLVMWLAATWQNTHEEHRALVLAVESVILLLAVRPLRLESLAQGAVVFAALGAGWEIQELIGQANAHALADRVGLGSAVAAGALLLVNALVQRRFQPPADLRAANPLVTVYSALSLACWLTATIIFTPARFLAPLLALEALALTAAFHPLRLRETAIFGQVFLLVAQALWLAGAGSGQPRHPWWNPAAVIVITLALSQWWQRQRVLELQKELRAVLQGVYALAVVGLLFFWLQPEFAAPDWLAFAGLLALLLTAYGVFSRSWLVAAAGQIFLVVSGVEFVRHLLYGPSAWWFPLAPVVVLLVLSLGTVKWFEGRADANAQIRKILLNVSLIYRVAAAAMALWWVERYINERERCWVFALAGFALFLLAQWRRNREILVFAGVFTLAGVARFVAQTDSGLAVYWANLPALLLLPLAQRIAKHQSGRFPLAPEIHGGMIIVSGLSLWVYLSRWVTAQSSDFYLTASWSVLALILFAAGMAWHERVYRWLGLGLLACALGRVVVVDIWKLETIYRILSFFALGIALLVLGFIYNKYQERIKQWL